VNFTGANDLHPRFFHGPSNASGSRSDAKQFQQLCNMLGVRPSHDFGFRRIFVMKLLNIGGIMPN
jgi:hypothetical protein